MFGIVLGCNNTFWDTPVWLMWGKRSNKPKNDRMVGSGSSIGIPTMDLNGQFQGKCGQPNKMPKHVVHLVYHILVYSSYLLVQDWTCIRDEMYYWVTLSMSHEGLRKAAWVKGGYQNLFWDSSPVEPQPLCKNGGYAFLREFYRGENTHFITFPFQNLCAWLTLVACFKSNLANFDISCLST